MKLLKLNALDTDDLAILSANLQDAVITMSDMSFLDKQHQFIMVLNRFDWKDALEPERIEGAPYKRHRTGLQIGRVQSVRQQNLKPANSEDVIALLAIEFEEADAPSGSIKLQFAGGGVIQLNVECIEARMSDMGDTWETGNLPNHEEED